MYLLTHGTYLCQVDEVGPAAAEQGGEDREEGRDGKKKKNRCLSCKKKVGLTGGSFLPLVGNRYGTGTYGTYFLPVLANLSPDYYHLWPDQTLVKVPYRVPVR